MRSRRLLDVAPCEVEQLCSPVICRPDTDDRGASSQHVDVAVAPEAESISGDPAKLHDVVRNLVENAVNYSPDRAESVEAATADGYVAITVSDPVPAFPERRSRPGLRALLPRRQGALAARRHGARPRDRPPPGRAPWRPRQGREPSEGGARFTVTYRSSINDIDMNS